MPPIEFDEIYAELTSTRGQNELRDRLARQLSLNSSDLSRRDTNEDIAAIMNIYQTHINTLISDKLWTWMEPQTRRRRRKVERHITVLSLSRDQYHLVRPRTPRLHP